MADTFLTACLLLASGLLLACIGGTCAGTWRKPMAAELCGNLSLCCLMGSVLLFLAG